MTWHHSFFSLNQKKGSMGEGYYTSSRSNTRSTGTIILAVLFTVLVVGILSAPADTTNYYTVEKPHYTAFYGTGKGRRTQMYGPAPSPHYFLNGEDQGFGPGDSLPAYESSFDGRAAGLLRGTPGGEAPPPLVQSRPQPYDALPALWSRHGNQHNSVFKRDDAVQHMIKVNRQEPGRLAHGTCIPQHMDLKDHFQEAMGTAAPNAPGYY